MSFFNENKTKPCPPSQRFPTYCTGNGNSSRIQDSIRSLLKHCGAGKLLGVQHKSFNAPEGNKKDLKRFSLCIQFLWVISNLQPYARPRNWINQYNYLLEIPFVNCSSSWTREEDWNSPDCKLAGKIQLYWRAGIRNGLEYCVLKGYRNQVIFYPKHTAGTQ